MIDVEKISKAADFLNATFQKKANIAIVLGSGLGGPFVDSLKESQKISYKDIPHFPESTVLGHAGSFAWGLVEDIPVYILQGRVHFYEGHSLSDVTFPIRVLKKIEVKTLIVTNASGIVQPSLKPGEFMIIKDHINFMGHNPLRGKNDEAWGPRFPDLTHAYDKDFRIIAKRIAKKIHLTLHEGVYVGVPGPSYETPAEVKMFRRLGGHAVGMSTVPEVIVARHQGMRVFGISCLANYAASHHTLTHEDVLAITQKASKKFGHFLKEFIINIK